MKLKIDESILKEKAPRNVFRLHVSVVEETIDRWSDRYLDYWEDGALHFSCESDEYYRNVDNMKKLIEVLEIYIHQCDKMNCVYSQSSNFETLFEKKFVNEDEYLIIQEDAYELLGTEPLNENEVNKLCTYWVTYFDNYGYEHLVDIEFDEPHS